MAELDSVDAQIAVNGSFAQAESFVASVTTEFDGSDEAVAGAAAVVNALGQAFALNRLSFLAQVASDYPARKRGGGGNPNWKGGKGGGSTDTGVTGAQKGLIERLLDEKVGASDVFDGDFGTLDKKSASDTIEKLIALADK